MIDEELAFFADWAKMRDCSLNIDEMEIGDLSLRLRRMLIDGNSLLHLVRRRHQKEVRLPSLSSGKVDLSASIALYPFSQNTPFSNNLDSFLSFQILEINGIRLSIRKVIKLIANNLGGVHFDASAASKVVSARFQSGEVIQAFRLAIFYISKATSAGTNELAQLCSPFPDYSKFLGHYGIGNKDPRALHFESHHCMDVQYPENTEVSAINVLAVLEALPQERKLSTLISFSLCNTSTFEVLLSSQGDIKVYHSRKKKRIDLRLDDRRQIRPIGKQVYLKASIEKIGLDTILEVDLQGRKKNKRFEHPIDRLNLQRCVIGGNQSGKLGAGFLLSELCILSANEPTTNDKIVQYFQYRYLK